MVGEVQGGGGGQGHGGGIVALVPLRIIHGEQDLSERGGSLISVLLLFLLVSRDLSERGCRVWVEGGRNMRRRPRAWGGHCGAPASTSLSRPTRTRPIPKRFSYILFSSRLFSSLFASRIVSYRHGGGHCDGRASTSLSRPTRTRPRPRRFYSLLSSLVLGSPPPI